MGKTKRDLLKRKASQLHKHLTEGVAGFAELEILFREHHPELANGLIAGAQLANESDKILLLFIEVAWSMDEDALESYRR